MSLEIAAPIALFGVPIYDRLLASHAASFMRSFNYRYRPFTGLRRLSYIALLIGTFVTFLLADPPEERIWVGLPWLGAMLFHGAVVMIDIFRQRADAALRSEGN